MSENVECFFCKRYRRPIGCASPPSVRGPYRQHPLTGEWGYDGQVWDAPQLVKEGRANWPCKPILTWRGRRKYKQKAEEKS